MARIAVVFIQRFEDSEYRMPAKVFQDAGHELIHLGVDEGGSIEGSDEKAQIRIDKALRDVSVNDFDALLIPGGYHPRRFCFNREEAEFVKKFIESGKPVLGTRRAD